ncbi:MAG TPA: hypothetical protein VJ718_07080, partial [Candidatus Binataceae bacterium]|nr:hypothetical protein [Candidatus Binataceae bacterium]
DVRLRIRAALGEMSERASEVRRAGFWSIGASRPEGKRSLTRVKNAARKLYIGVPALAALLIVALIVSGRIHTSTRTTTTAIQPIRQFDFAINQFQQMADDFVPNVPVDAFNSSQGIYYAWVVNASNRQPDERLDLSRSYSELNMPSDLYNFAESGYRVAGGRFEHLADGRPVSYTLYRGPDGALMNICIVNPHMEMPVGASYWVGMHSFYSYKHYSLCVTFDPTGRFVSILISRQPLINLVRDVTLAEAEVTAQR